MKILPSVADLFLLPKAFDQASRTKLDEEDNAIVSEMSSPEKARGYVEHLRSYPHAHCTRDEAKVRVRVREAPNEMMVAQWPDGRSVGAVIYESGHFMLIDPRAATEALAAGQPVTTLHASLDDTMLQPLERYHATGATKP